MTAPAASRTTDVLVVAAEALLLAVTIAGIAGFARLFSDTEWAGPLIAAAVVAHITMAACRRLRRGLLVTGLVALVVMLLQISWTHYGSTTRALLPTGRTRDALDVDLTAAWNLFGEVKAPTEAVTGFVVLASLAVWVIAYLADWAAFRLWSPLESMLPAFATVVFIAFFGEEANRLFFAGLYVAAVISFQLADHMVRQGREVRWLAGAARLGTSSLVATGAMLSVVAVLGAVTIGPALPGADDEALVDLEERNSGPSTRVVVSPIVDIRGRLVEQPDVEAFTVRSEQPSYWRLASLDNFNGQIWGADNKYGRVSGSLPDDFPSSAETQVLEQVFTIENMGAVWLPAAYEPRAVTSATADAISYEPVSGTLIVSTDLENSDGLTYELTSEVPSFDPVELADASATYPQAILDRYLQLPDDFSPTATTTALTEIAGATTTYDKALALQDFFRGGQFTYNKNVGQGHSNNRIDEFLAVREGYCEQFAGTYAAMARAVGLPARVAVGFTWGDQDPDDPNLYHVRGEHAHAWPEVYIPGSGWVAFEPTPSRGAPGSEGWTGIEAEQSNGLDETDGPQTEGVAPTPIPTDNGSDDPTDPGGVQVPEDPTEPTETTTTGGGDNVPGWLQNAGLAVLAMAAISGLYAAAVIFAKRTKQQRRIAAASDNSERVGAIWRNAVDALGPMGLRRQSAETIGEFTRRVGRTSGAVQKPLSGLGDITVVAAYSGTEVDEKALGRARAHHEAIETAVVDEIDFTTRMRHLLDPRPLFRR